MLVCLPGARSGASRSSDSWHPGYGAEPVAVLRRRALRDFSRRRTRRPDRLDEWAIGGPALLQGDFDYSTLADTMMRAATTGLPVKVIAFGGIRPALALNVRPEIKTAADLKGKSIAVTSIGSTTDIVAREIVRILRAQSRARYRHARAWQPGQQSGSPARRRGARRDLHAALRCHRRERKAFASRLGWRCGQRTASSWPGHFRHQDQQEPGAGEAHGARLRQRVWCFCAKKRTKLSR